MTQFSILKIQLSSLQDKISCSVQIEKKQTLLEDKIESPPVGPKIIEKTGFSANTKVADGLITGNADILLLATDPMNCALFQILRTSKNEDVTLDITTHFSRNFKIQGYCGQIHY